MNGIVQERRTASFDGMTCKLEEPANQEHDERPSPAEKEQRQGKHDQGNADRVTELIQRMLVL